MNLLKNISNDSVILATSIKGLYDQCSQLQRAVRLFYKFRDTKIYSEQTAVFPEFEGTLKLDRSDEINSDKNFVVDQVRYKVNKHKPLFLLFIVLVLSAVSGAERIEVVYPDLNPRYNTVVDLVVQGIQKRTGDSKKVIYKSDTTFSDHSIVLTSKVKREIETKKEHKDSMHVYGLLEISKNENIYGVSLFIEPAVYIEEVLALRPEIRRIQFFNDNRRGVKQDIPELEELFNVSIESFNAATVGQAIDMVSDAQMRSDKTTAMIFTRGFIEFSEGTLLNLILAKTWNSSTITVTNKPQYVKRGITLGVAPDFAKYGEQIADLYSEALSERFTNPRVQYLNRCISAINERTAKHLRIDLNKELMNRYKLIYSGN